MTTREFNSSQPLRVWAEKIKQVLWSVWMERSDQSKATLEIESLLGQMVDEAEIRFCHDASITTDKEKEVRAQALEEAAKVADEICFCANQCKSNTDYHDIDCNACDVADKIRSLKDSCGPNGPIRGLKGKV